MSGYIINTDSNAIEERERQQKEQSQQNTVKRFEFNEKNYLNTRLKEGETEKEIKIRILPISATEGDIFLSLNIHSLKVNKEVAKSTFKTYVCLNDKHIKEHDGRGCPLCNKSKELFNEANNVENDGEKKTILKSAYSYQTKRAYIVRVIERGKEDEGVKFWRFNERTDGLGIYDKLMKLYKRRKEEAAMAGQENYSIFDLNNGKDITITMKYVPTTGKTSIDIMDSGFQSPLSKDIDLANKWISDEKTWRDIYALKSYDYLEIVGEGKVPAYDTQLQKWVEKVDNTAYNGKEEQIQEAKNILNDNVNQVVDNMVNNPMSDDDLPF